MDALPILEINLRDPSRETVEGLRSSIPRNGWRWAGRESRREESSSVVLPLMTMEIMAATGPRTFYIAELDPCLVVKKKTLLVTGLVDIFSHSKSNIPSL